MWKINAEKQQTARNLYARANSAREKTMNLSILFRFDDPNPS